MAVEDKHLDEWRVAVQDACATEMMADGPPWSRAFLSLPLFVDIAFVAANKESEHRLHCIATVNDGGDNHDDSRPTILLSALCHLFYKPRASYTPWSISGATTTDQYTAGVS